MPVCVSVSDCVYAVDELTTCTGAVRPCRVDIPIPDNIQRRSAWGATGHGGKLCRSPPIPSQMIGSAAASAPSTWTPADIASGHKHGHGVDLGPACLPEPGRSCYLDITDVREEQSETVTNGYDGPPAGEISGAPAIGGIGNYVPRARHAPTGVEKGGNDKAGQRVSLSRSPHWARSPCQRPGSPCVIRRGPDI